MRLIAATSACLLLASVVVAEDPGEPAARDRSRSPQPSEWETLDKVVETLGKPAKRRPDGKGGTVLFYKLDVNSGLKLTAGEVWIVDGALSSAPSPDERGWVYSVPSGGIGPQARGKLKARFYFDADGIVYDVQLDPVKWKGGP